MKLAEDARVAVYYAPDSTDPLWQAGSAWLGRDAAGGASLARSEPCGIGRLTEAPRQYGFHATLKPPFRVRKGLGWDDVVQATRTACDGQAAFALPELVVGTLDGFLALLERHRSPPLRGLADLIVEGLDGLRAPPEEAELARRRTSALTDTQDEMLVRWGYPAVFGLWQFHMTLSDRLTHAQHAHYLPAAEQEFAEACRAPRQVQDVCLFVQPAPGQDFVLAERVALGSA